MFNWKDSRKQRKIKKINVFGWKEKDDKKNKNKLNTFFLFTKEKKGRMKDSFPRFVSSSPLQTNRTLRIFIYVTPSD